MPGAPDTDERLTDELAEDCAHLHVLQARIGRRLLEVEEADAWAGSGIRSIEHWASMALGLAVGTARSLLETARKLAVLPTIEAAMQEGRLSFDKAKAIAPVATPATQQRWMELADQTTITQLQRIVAAWRKVDADGQPDEPADPHEQRRLWWTSQRNGLERLTVLLTPEDAAVVRAAITNAVEHQWRSAPPEDRADEPGPARAADALAAMAETAMAAGPRAVEGGDRIGVNLIVDIEVLAGRKVDGICQLEQFGHPLPLADAELLACDAIIRPLLVKGGTPVDVGRERRLVNRAQRRALKARHGGCAFPGCGHARFVDAHHVDHWIHGGRTDLSNLVLLCRFHHRLHHRGGYQILTTERPGHFLFADTHGKPIGRPPDPRPVTPATLRHRTGIEPTWLTPHAKDCGGPLDLHAVVNGILDAEQYGACRAN